MSRRARGFGQGRDSKILRPFADAVEVHVSAPGTSSWCSPWCREVLDTQGLERAASQKMRDAGYLTPIRWRIGPPPGHSGSLYQAVREHLWRVGGSCTRDELLEVMLSNTALRNRLFEGQGFSRLLTNMRHSGEILLEGELVRATSRALRRGNSSRPQETFDFTKK